jgi:hypothetical protein
LTVCPATDTAFETNAATINSRVVNMLRGVSAFDPIFLEPKVYSPVTAYCSAASDLLESAREKDLIWFEPKRVQQFLKSSGGLLPLFCLCFLRASAVQLVFSVASVVGFAFDFPLCSSVASVVKVLGCGSATVWPLW